MFKYDAAGNLLRSEKGALLHDTAGQYDLYVYFANQFGWPPETVRRLPVRMVSELIARQEAVDQLQERERKRQERKGNSGRGGG